MAVLDDLPEVQHYMDQALAHAIGAAAALGLAEAERAIFIRHQMALARYEVSTALALEGETNATHFPTQTRH